MKSGGKQVSRGHIQTWNILTVCSVSGGVYRPESGSSEGVGVRRRDVDIGVTVSRC